MLSIFLFAEGLNFFRQLQTGIRNGWIKVNLSPWRSIALKMPVTSDDRGKLSRDVRQNSMNWARVSPWKLLTGVTHWNEASWDSDGLDEGKSTRRGRFKGITPSRRLRKVCKADVGSQMPRGRDVSSIVRTRWGLRPLNVRFSPLAVTCTFNSKYRWQEMQTSFPCYFHQAKFLLFMNPLTNLKLTFLQWKCRNTSIVFGLEAIV